MSFSSYPSVEEITNKLREKLTDPNDILLFDCFVRIQKILTDKWNTDHKFPNPPEELTKTRHTIAKLIDSIHDKQKMKNIFIIRKFNAKSVLDSVVKQKTEMTEEIIEIKNKLKIELLILLKLLKQGYLENMPS